MVTSVPTESTLDPSVQAPWPKLAYAWYVTAMLVLAYGFAILDRAVISLMVGPIKTDLGITDSQIGLLQGLAFAICYTTFGMVLGYITDRTNRRWLLFGGIFIWSLSTVLCGFANSFETLFIARIGVGLGEACVLPCSGSILADYFPPKHRAKAYGIFLLGGSLGTGLGYMLGGIAIDMADAMRAYGPAFLADAHNWQITFIAAGFPGIIVALLFLFTVREPVRREKAAPATYFTLRPLWNQLRANARAYTTLLLGTVLNVMCIYAQIGWIATALIREHGWTATQAGTTLAILTPVGATSSITVAWAMTWFANNGRSDAPMLAALGHAIATLVFATACYLMPLPWAVIGYCGVNLFANWSSAAALQGLSQITPNELRGQVVAFYTLLTGLVSLSLGSFAVGFLADHAYNGATHSVSWSLATVSFTAGILGIAIIQYGRPAFRAAAKAALAWQKN